MNANTHVGSLMGRLTLRCVVEDIQVMAEGLTGKVQNAKGESNRLDYISRHP